MSKDQRVRRVPPTLSVPIAARIALDEDRAGAYRAANSGLLPTVRVGGRVVNGRSVGGRLVVPTALLEAKVMFRPMTFEDIEYAEQFEAKRVKREPEVA